MKRFIILLIATSSLILLTVPASSTTIIPFPNLGEMAKASPVVVYAKAERNYEVEFNNATRYRTQFSIINQIKGNIENGFSVQNMRLKKGDLNRIVSGDMEFEEGVTYLLFLTNYGDCWQTIMMSHGILQEQERNGEVYLFPVQEGLNYFYLRRPDGQEVEQFYVYEKNNMISMLQEVCAGDTTWDLKKVKTDLSIQSFLSADRVAPSHCTFLGAPAPLARWTDFPGTPLPVHYSSTVDAGCPSSNAKVQAVIGSLNASYTGLNLSDGGTHTYVPPCSGGEGATDTDFTTWVNTNLSGSRHIVVQYDDPCNEIPDLSGCSGTLAFGGFYWFSSTHTWDGVDWNPGAYGYVVVNNGTGACQCPSTDYDIMMTHELTHSLGIGHVSTADGVANMNPSCCEAISALDIECLDYTYLDAALPIELLNFSGELNENKSQLYWSTSHESNNSFFTIERSLDGQRFEKIGQIASQGNSSYSQAYNFIDDQPTLGKKNYYRLSQTDFDGRSNIVGDVVVLEPIAEFHISVQPNPIEGDLINIALSTLNNQELELRLFDLNGRLISYQQRTITRGLNTLKIPVADLNRGVYFLRTVIDGNIQNVKILKTQ